MSRTEFNQLSVGDYVEFMRGPDVGNRFQVVFIEDYHNICLRSMYGSFFAPVSSNSSRRNVKLKVVTGSGLYKVW